MITNPIKIHNKFQAPVRQTWREVEKKIILEFAEKNEMLEKQIENQNEFYPFPLIMEGEITWLVNLNLFLT
jgi:hypothetical protein